MDVVRGRGSGGGARVNYILCEKKCKILATGSLQRDSMHVDCLY